jgi:hypothetical protein
MSTSKKVISSAQTPTDRLGESQSPLTLQECWILRWLLRYPLLRVVDLVFLCTEMSRASLYRCLARMAEQGWVEAIASGALGHQSAAWYYLSNQGVHVVAADLGHDPAELARTYEADERGLLRWLPRLSRLMVIQEFLADLCRSAPHHLTYQGQRSAIAWHWLRDYRYPVQDQQRSATCTVDVLLILRMRPHLPTYPDASRQEQIETQARAQERWYCLHVVLDTLLLDATQIRTRLKLLCLARDQQTAASFPVTLIVLAAPEREALWRACMRRLEETHHLAPLHAALAVYPTSSERVFRADGQVWRLPWQRLSPQTPWHLHELLVLQTVEKVAAPLLTSLEMQANEAQQFSTVTKVVSSSASTGEGSSLPVEATGGQQSATPRGRLARIVRGHFAERLASSDSSQGEETIPLPLTCLTLSQRMITLLVRVEVCPFASTEEIAVWEDLQPASAGRYLGQLKRAGWLRSASEVLPPETADRTGRWVLSEQGIRALALIYHLPWKRLAVSLKLQEDQPTTHAAEEWVPRRAALIVRTRTVAHVMGLYAFFAHLALAAAEQRGDQLRWWSRELGQRYYQWNGNTYQFHPDAFAEYASGERGVRFWLEYEAGDPSVRDLATRLTAYGTYLRSREWMREQTPLPMLCYLVQGPAQEQRLARVVAKLSGGLSGCRLAVTTTGRVQQAGVLKPIWWRLLPARENDRKDVPLHRMTLLEL